jgi:uncharacterized protein
VARFGLDTIRTGARWVPSEFPEVIVLELRPNCECCDVDLPPGSPDARICSFECTFCVRCAEGHLGGRCPNCRGPIVVRPIRLPTALVDHPASTVRVQSSGCPGVPAGT